MPLKTFWEVEHHLNRIDSMIDTSDDRVLIKERLILVLRKVEPYAVMERDRNYLRQRFNGSLIPPQNKV